MTLRCTLFGCNHGPGVDARWLELEVVLADRTCSRCGETQEYAPVGFPRIVRRRGPTEPSSQVLVAELRAQLAECRAALEPFAQCFGRADESHPEDVVCTDALTDEDFERAFDAMKAGK